jgi:hypothetical protein
MDFGDHLGHIGNTQHHYASKWNQKNEAKTGLFCENRLE